MDTKRLRQKILDLAIRGKLVEQDPSDEPASELLRRIHEEKLAMVERGELQKKYVNNDVIIGEGADGLLYEEPFDGKGSRTLVNHALRHLPDGWAWARMSTVAKVEAGKTPSKDSFVSDGVPYFKMYNLRNQHIDFDYQPQYIKPEVHNGLLAKSRIHPGDLIMNIVGPPLGKLAIVPDDFPEANTNQAAVVISPFSEEVPAIWLFHYLSEMSEIDSITTRGSAGQVNISVNQSRDMLVAVPPLAEQERIVAKLDEYLGLVDEIEKNQVALDELFPKLKAKVLDLAIRGELSERDPSDEPASELLARIHEEKLAMVGRGELKKKDVAGDTVIYVGGDGLHYEGPVDGKGEAKCVEAEIPFEVPEGWNWGRLGTVADYGSAAAAAPTKIPDTAWILDLEDIEKDSGKIVKKLAKCERDSASAKVPFTKGQLLYSKLRPYLNKVLIADDDGFCTSEIVPISSFGSVRCDYLRLCMMSPYYLAYANHCSYGCKMPRLSAKQVKTSLIPIPPLAEQERIVEAVDKIFAAIDF